MSSLQGFVDSDQFEEVKKRSIFIHIDVPGQENNSENLKEMSFPTIQALGEDLVTVLDQLRVKYCIGIGDGAGANIITRFGMMHVTRYLLIQFRENKEMGWVKTAFVSDSESPESQVVWVKTVTSTTC